MPDPLQLANVMDMPIAAAATVRRGAFRRRVGWVFGLQLLIILTVSALGARGLLPVGAMIAVVVLATLLAWLAVRHEWRSVRRLARTVNRLNHQAPDATALQLRQTFAATDADVAALASALQEFAGRIAQYTQRERNFTRDASHELRSPLTVIKMSVDMLVDETDWGRLGQRSVRRIRRASREMESLVEALLVLAREPGEYAEERFVVNDLLRIELESARELLAGLPIELQLEESARYALSGSPRAFSVLCWQLIRNACQQIDSGRVLVRVAPGMVTVSNHETAPALAPVMPGPQRLRGSGRHGFDMAIARRISDRFHWPLELQTLAGQQNVARVRLDHTLPIEAAAPVSMAARH